MTPETVLITGGAGFIGSHTADRLLAAGYRVRVMDSLIPQVHGEGRRRPAYLNTEVELQIGDVRDASAIDLALEDVTYVYHLAADTGVGQSMYALGQYFSTNVLGTAQLWEGIQKRPGQIKRFILASSRAIYGEGRYSCARCGDVVPDQRSEEQLLRADWRHHCPVCSAELEPRPSDENTPPASRVGVRPHQEDPGGHLPADGEYLGCSDCHPALFQRVRTETIGDQPLHRGDSDVLHSDQERPADSVVRTRCSAARFCPRQ